MAKFVVVVLWKIRLARLFFSYIMSQIYLIKAHEIIWKPHTRKWELVSKGSFHGFYGISAIIIRFFSFHHHFLKLIIQLMIKKKSEELDLREIHTYYRRFLLLVCLLHSCPNLGFHLSS